MVLRNSSNTEALQRSKLYQPIKLAVVPYIGVCQVQLTNMKQSLTGQRVVSHQGVPCVDEQTLSADRYRATCHFHVHHVLLLGDQVTMIVATVHCQENPKEINNHKGLTKNPPP